MKVGDYVRIKPEQNGRCGIDKLIRIENQGSYNDYYFEKYRGVVSNPEHFIANSSPDILDLIGCGDVLIIKEYCDEACQIFTGIYLIQNDEKLLNVKEYLKNKNHKLYSIVTKEQFESMQYEVK